MSTSRQLLYHRRPKQPASAPNLRPVTPEGEPSTPAPTVARERGREGVDDGLILDAADELDLARPRRDADVAATTPSRA